jgi:hypothetical protein
VTIDHGEGRTRSRRSEQRPAANAFGLAIRPSTAVLRFHLGAGVRLALSASVPLAGAFVIVAGLSPDPGAFVAGLAVELSTGRGASAVPLLAAALALAIAQWASPRVCHGAAGWMRHLPVSGDAHRRATLLALVVAQAPLLLGAAVLMLGAAAYGIPVLPARIAGLPLVGLGAACAVLPVRRRGVAVPAGAAVAAAGMAGSFALLGAGALMLVAADRIAGSVGDARPRRSLREIPGLGIAARIALRALGLRPAGAAAAALLPLLAGWLFVRNNRPESWVADGAARLAGVASVTLLLAGLAEALAARRPAWPWARSLPWSARTRAAADAALLAAFGFPFSFLTAPVAPRAVFPVMAAVPLLALRAAAAIRRAPAARTGAQGQVLLEGLLLAGWIALSPWVAAAALVAVPAALRLAAASERDVKVGRWIALHHLAAGDPLSWSGR